MTDKHIEDSSAPLIEHLIELRTRLIYALTALGIATVICFIFRFEMWDFLSGPLLRADPDATVQTLNPQETFFTIMNLSIWGGFFFGFPFIAYQVWALSRRASTRTNARPFCPT